MKIVKYNGEKPTQGTEYAAGYDLRSLEDVIIEPNTSGKVVSSTKIQSDMNLFHIAVPRSSLCNKNGLILMNSLGIIDPDYTGATVWNFWNLSSEPVAIKKGERIGQVVFMNRIAVNFVNEAFIYTDRGEGGFGSTGVY